MKGLGRFKSLKTSILSSFILLLVCFGLFNTYSFISNNSVENKAQQLVETDLVILNASQQLAVTSSVRFSAALGYVLTGQQLYMDSFNEARQLAEETNAIIEQHVQTEERAKLVKTARQWSDIVEQDVFAVYQAGDVEQAQKNLTDASNMVTEVRLGYEAMANERAAAIELSGTDMVDSSSSNKVVGLAVSLILTVLGVVIGLITANNISKPINLVAKRMEVIADGNLSYEPLAVNRQDEIGTLTSSINEMNDKLKGVVQSIHSASETVASSSEELAQSSNEVKIGSEQVSYTMQELASGSETQASASTTLAETMRIFTERIQETTDEGTTLKGHSEQVEHLTESGKQLMANSTNQMAIINDIMLNSVEKVEGLNEQSAEISKLVSVIDDISNQTNLLALNAAIEAARAGEHGKGFAVVADEVRKLAEQVKFSVADISAIVNRIQDGTGDVTQSLQDGYEEVKRGTSQISETGVTFNEISTAVFSMVGSIEAISSNLQSVLANTEELGTSIDEIAAISQQSAAGIEETTATIEETVSTIDEVANSTQQLSVLAEQLNSEMQKFKL